MDTCANTDKTIPINESGILIINNKDNITFQRNFGWKNNKHNIRKYTSLALKIHTWGNCRKCKLCQWSFNERSETQYLLKALDIANTSCNITEQPSA
jgi:hypothetical protein